VSEQSFSANNFGGGGGEFGNANLKNFFVSARGQKFFQIFSPDT
jgi:hypothetical protein